MRILKSAAAIAAALAMSVALGAVGASPASAETISRGGKKTATIRPAAAPAGALAQSATITVKKGSKTVAKNKASYKAKKGTYKVTSTLTYYPLTVRAGKPDEVWAECRVEALQITSDRTDFRDYDKDGVGYYAGQVTVHYTGTCTDTIYTFGVSDTYTWQSSWNFDDWVATEDVSVSADRIAAITADLSYGLGDVDMVEGPALAALPKVKTLGTLVSAKTTRTVKVK